MPQGRLELPTFAYLSDSSTAYKYDALTDYATGAAHTSWWSSSGQSWSY